MNEPRNAPAVDLRLVPAAVTVWLAALTGVLWGWPFAVGTGLVAAGLAGVALVRGWAARTAVLAALGSGIAAVVWVGLPAYRASVHPLRPLADQNTPASVRITLTERPRGLASAGFGERKGGVDRVAVHAELQSAEVRGQRVEPGGQVLLLAPADRWLDLLPGNEVTAVGTLAPPRGGDLTVAVLRVRGPPQQVAAAPAWQRAAESLRAGLRRACAVLAPEPAGLLPALTVGDTTAVPAQVTDEFRVAGLAHLTAVSGANLAIVCGAVLLLLRLLRCGPRPSCAVALLALAGFVVLAGPEPSVLRAAVMGAVGLLALALGRERSAVPALATAVVVLVLHDPQLGVAPGFALSVLATAALVLLAPAWSARLRARGVPALLANAAVTPVAAALATAPLIAGLSGQISLVTVIANLVASPVVAPATVLGVVAAGVAPLHLGIAQFAARLAEPAVTWLIWVGRHAADVPHAAIGWPSGWGGGLLLLGVTATVVGLVRLPRLRAVLAVVLAVTLLVVLPTRLDSPGWPVSGWAAVGCDVGQGDAIVLATAEQDRVVLVDTGPEPVLLARCLRRLNVRSVPLVVLSHLHADHVGGLTAVLADHEVGAVAVGPSREPRWAWDEVRAQAEHAGVPLVELSVGQRLSWPGLVLEVLGPDHPVGGDESPVNNASLVLRASTPAGRVLLTGDVEVAAQQELLDSGVDLSADVLKVPHHGSRNSLPRFLAAVRPRVALISVGAGNRYGHPNQSIVDSLSGRGALVLRTDRDGDSAVLASPTGLRVARLATAQPP